MQVLPPWRVVRALVKWDKPAMVPLAVSLGSLSNPWLERRLHLVGRCQVAAWAWLVAPRVAAWAPQVDRWVAWA